MSSTMRWVTRITSYLEGTFLSYERDALGAFLVVDTRADVRVAGPFLEEQRAKEAAEQLVRHDPRRWKRRA